jgi:hypothetical protein
LKTTQKLDGAHQSINEEEWKILPYVKPELPGDKRDPVADQQK